MNKIAPIGWTLPKEATLPLCVGCPTPSKFGVCTSKMHASSIDRATAQIAMGNTMTYAPSTRDMRCRPIDAAGVPNKEVIERLGRLYCEAADLPEDLQASLTSKWAESGNMVVPGSLRNLRPAQWT